MVGQMDIPWWAIALVPFISAGAGAYVGGYLKKKGENLATHEDIDKVLDQVRAVTTTTKEIEAKISTEVWDRQKRWELKREVLIDAVKSLADIHFVTIKAHALLTGNADDHEKRINQIAACRTECVHSFNRFNGALGMLAVVCTKPTQEVFDEYRSIAGEITTEVLTERDKQRFTTNEILYWEKLEAVRAAVRKELGVDAAS
jgi:hypothetical protein